MLSAQQQAFINQYYSFAKEAETATGVPAQVILAQWINETGAGTSSAFKQKHNFAGVMSGGTPKTYTSEREGLTGYINTMKLSYYNQVRSAGTVEGAAKALVASPWEATGYQQGKLLYPLVTDVSSFIGGVKPTSVQEVSSYNGGIANKLPTLGSSLNTIPSGGAIPSTVTDYSGAVSKGAVIFVAGIAALVALILVIRYVKGSKVTKLVTKTATKGMIDNG